MIKNNTLRQCIDGIEDFLNYKTEVQPWDQLADYLLELEQRVKNIELILTYHLTLEED